MKHLPVLAILMLFFFAACQKDEQPQINNTSTQNQALKRLVNINWDNLPDNWVKLKYDSKGRVIEVDGDEDIYTITYQNNQVHVSEFRKAENRIVFDFTGKLNAKGHVTEGSGTSSYTGKVYQETYKFEYDAAGNLVMKFLDRNNGELTFRYDYFYKNGNLSGFDAYMNGVLDYSGAYEYYADREDRSKINWEQFSTANTFTGNVNKNLMSKYTGFRDGKESWHVNFTYDFDADGYPVSATAAYSSGKTYILSYKYQ